jgi:hypothetical protein
MDDNGRQGGLNQGLDPDVIHKVLTSVCTKLRVALQERELVKNTIESLHDVLLSERGEFRGDANGPPAERRRPTRT